MYIILFLVAHTLPIKNVIAVQSDSQRISTPASRSHLYSFTLHYAKKGPKSTWKYSNITFRHTDPMQVASWVKTIQNHLNSKCMCTLMFPL